MYAGVFALIETSPFHPDFQKRDDGPDNCVAGETLLNA